MMAVLGWLLLCAVEEEYTENAAAFIFCGSIPSDMLHLFYSS